MVEPASPPPPPPDADGSSEVLAGEVLSPDQVKARADLERLSRVLDTKFRIPGTRIRFGADAIAGLIPGVGDTVGLVASAVVIAQAVALGARGWTLARMVGTVAIDAVVGSIPIAGTVFDVAFKANTRNVALLDRHVQDPAAAGAASRKSIVVTTVVVVVSVAVLCAALVGLVIWLWTLLT